MNDSQKSLRKTYRAQMRTDFRNAGFWVFTAGLYCFTFISVALVAFIGGFISEVIFHATGGNPEPPLLTAVHWANLIETIYLIAVGVLYIWGGPAGIPFLSQKTGDDGN